MDKLIIFDLKNTLVNPLGESIFDTTRIIEVARENNVKVVLYSMNEVWSYKTLFSYLPLGFNEIRLVGKKQSSDFTQYQDLNAMVIGDSDDEELSFARMNNFVYIDAKKGISTDKVLDFIRS
jgi:hypothetical protein